MLDADDERMLWLDKVRKADVVVFDLDGTLIETDVANQLAYEAAITHYLGQCPEVLLDPTERVTREVLRARLPAAPETVIQKIVGFKDKIYGHFLNATKANRPVLGLLESAQGKDVVLATGCRRARAELILSHHGLREKFTRKYFCESDTLLNRYKRIFSDLDVDLPQVVIFDNDPASISAAIASGAEANSVFLVGTSW